MTPDTVSRFFVWLPHTIELFHLRAADSRQHVRETIIVANRVVDIFDRIIFSLCRKVAGTCRPLGVVGNHHAAAAGGDDFVAVKTEATDVPDAADAFSAIARA